MAKKFRNPKSGSSSSSSNKQRRTYAQVRSSARSNNRVENQQVSLSTQNSSTRRKNASNRSLQMRTTMRAREKATLQRSLALLSDFRRGKGTFEELLREHHLARRTAYKYLGRDLRRGGRGQRVRPSKADSRVRPLFFPAPSGDSPARIRGSHAASKLSEFFTDREKLLGNKMSAEEFEAKWRGVRIAGQEVFADAATIFLRADAGDLKIESLYATVGGAE